MSGSAPQTQQQISHSKLRDRLFATGAGVLGVGFALAQLKGWLNWVPDPLIGLLIGVPLMYFIYWLWTHEGVRKRRYLIYTYPIMSLIILVAVGACIGGSLGAFAWWTTHRQEHSLTSPTQTTITEVTSKQTPQPSPIDAPSPKPTVTIVESPRTTAQPHPSARKPSGKRSKAAEQQRRREEALRDLDYKKPQR
jgi:hypothetical protein